MCSLLFGGGGLAAPQAPRPAHAAAGTNSESIPPGTKRGGRRPRRADVHSMWNLQ